MDQLSLIEICAGAGGQALGLEQAGFTHDLAIELDGTAAQTLAANLGADRVRVGDVADRKTWDPAAHAGAVDLFAGGVPCPPFSTAGHQRGARDERDLFAWAVNTVRVLGPRAILLENVRGLSMPRFSGYRQHVLDALRDSGYVADWRLLFASDYGVPQLRPRFVLIAMRPEYWRYFAWPQPARTGATVGSALLDLMSSRDWPYASQWSDLAGDIGPTIVGGSKKHGGADLGPTRAREAWRRLFVDGSGIADDAPGPDHPPPSERLPKLTVEMAARLQGWSTGDPAHKRWMSNLAGRKTAQYRQVANAFPPPVARVLGMAVAAALRQEQLVQDRPIEAAQAQDPVYQVLRSSDRYLTISDIISLAGGRFTPLQVERRLSYLSQDFTLEVASTSRGDAYRVAGFVGFVGQVDHTRHGYIKRYRHRVS